MAEPAEAIPQAAIAEQAAPHVKASDAVALSQYLLQTRSWLRVAGAFYGGIFSADLLATARDLSLGDETTKVGTWLLPLVIAGLSCYVLLTAAKIELRGPNSEALPRLARGLHGQHRLWVGWALVVALKLILS
jgi:hypothetical protein